MGRGIAFKPATFYLGVVDHLARVVEGGEEPVPSSPQERKEKKKELDDKTGSGVHVEGAPKEGEPVKTGKDGKSEERGHEHKGTAKATDNVRDHLPKRMDSGMAHTPEAEGGSSTGRRSFEGPGEARRRGASKREDKDTDA
jgi:hypothetical protein